MIKTNFKLSKLICIILTAGFILSFMAVLQSCGNGGKEKRTAFTPPGGEYEIMLNPDVWSEVVVSADYSPDQIGLLNGTLSFMLIIDSYRKADLLFLEVSDINSFIDFYKTFEIPQTMYAPADGKTFGEIADIAAKDLSMSIFKSGKRQEIYAPERVCEFIYIETEAHYFAISYTSYEDKYAESQKAVIDLISHITIKK